MEQHEQVDRQTQLAETMDKLSHYCMYLTKNKWDSDEITQEAVLRSLIKYKDSFPPPVSLLKKIAYHAWIDRIRKQKKEELVSEIRETASDEKKDAEQQLEKLKKLTPKQLIVFALKEAFHFQTMEIADLLDLNDSAVKALLHRARLNIQSNTIHPLVQSSWENLNQEDVLEFVGISLQREDPAVLIRIIPDLFHAPSSSFGKNSNLCMAAA
ncbi:sigma factor-like helix-turn-helix DNA-binding protein [Terribacillus sp. 7520-G]|uniref:sigma factor-like helix-turn-helix DNA-binding protein n=1 Tax=unclassified Terribacillus TaxID=2636508 RepID=UPI000BA5EE05|nr:sigma factor-like helix-turn-helix DNA-binding protein [Terribacillus sp. 7520-G]PAD39187.1 hypothetical protein CHH53_07740 [Terribacillus sp. 7520-G]